MTNRARGLSRCISPLGSTGVVRRATTLPSGGFSRHVCLNPTNATGAKHVLTSSRRCCCCCCKYFISNQEDYINDRSLHGVGVLFLNLEKPRSTSGWVVCQGPRFFFVDSWLFSSVESPQKVQLTGTVWSMVQWSPSAFSRERPGFDSRWRHDLGIFKSVAK